MLSERFERSSGGRTAISALIVVVLLASVGSNLPPSAVQRSVGETAEEAARVLGNEQVWGVFAPDPRGTSLKLEAIVTFEDGSTARWTVPEGPALGANLRFYRWRKWIERVRSDGYSNLYEPTARWIASLYDDRDSPVTRVELVRSFHDNVVRGDQPPYEHFTYYTYDVPSPR